MALTDAEVIALELERVLPDIQTVFDYDDEFAGYVEKSSMVEKISNREMRVPLEVSPGGSFQYFDADGGDLGRGSGPSFDKAVVRSVFVSENIEYTKLAQWATDSDRKAITNGVRKLVARSTMELKRQLDNQLMQSGTGVIGTITSVSSNTLTLTTDGFGARLIRAKQKVQIFDATLATNRGSATVISGGVDVQNKTVTLDALPAGTVATDLIVTFGINVPASLPGIYGVPYHHSNAATGTWLGFNRASNPDIRASRINGLASSLTLPLPRLAINAIGNRTGLKNNFRPDAWMHPAQQQAYEEIGQAVSIIQKQAKEEGLDMYFDKMQMAGAPVKTSFGWDTKRIDFVSKKVWGYGEILPLGFYKTDGRTIFEIRGASGGVATADIFYQVVGRQYFVNNPAACSYIDNLLVPTGY